MPTNIMLPHTVVELVQHSLHASFFLYVTDNDEAIVSEEQENVPPIRTEDVSNRLIGEMKGIQGHCNSCYMDSALFRFELLLDMVYMQN